MANINFTKRYIQHVMSTYVYLCISYTLYVFCGRDSLKIYIHQQEH